MIMDSELLLKFIGYFADYLSALSRTLLRFFLDNLCRNSCIYLSSHFPPSKRLPGRDYVCLSFQFQSLLALPFLRKPCNKIRSGLVKVKILIFLLRFTEPFDINVKLID